MASVYDDAFHEAERRFAAAQRDQSILLRLRRHWLSDLPDR